MGKKIIARKALHKGSFSSKKRIEQDKTFPLTVTPNGLRNSLVVGLLAFVLAGVLALSGDYSSLFWILIVVGIVLVPNSLLLRNSFASPFILKYGITMLKTKRFISFIKSLARIGKVYELMCLIGLFLGFGLVGIDYWAARKRGGWKRIIILAIGAVLLYFVFTFSVGGISLGNLFSVPAIASLFWPCLVGFVILGFGGMSLALLVGYGLLAFFGLFAHKQLCPSVAPVLPGVPIPGLGVPIPMIGWVSLVLVLIIHEFSHAVMFAYYKEKIKSVGLLLAGIIPLGAFVEQDDKTFNNLEDKKALMVLSAGSASNLFTIFVAVILFFSLFFASSPLLSQFNSETQKMFDGVKINSVQDKISFCGMDVNAPAKGKLFEGDVIKQINGFDVNSIDAVNQQFRLSNSDINFVVERKNPDSNEFFDVNVSVAPYTFEQLGIKRIGVEFASIPTGHEPNPWVVFGYQVISALGSILLFLGVISFAAGSFNYFPADPFDGGKMAKIMLVPYFGFLGFNKKETQKLIGRIFIWVLIVSLTFNMIPYLTMFF
jgi:membrane-associated protease RseP (regulator of RpoE activity)